ncbi:MAG: CidA/LrgA family protein [Burkholderiales bacterium]
MSPLLAGFTWLLLFQCAGEALAYFTGIPVPGPVLGMALLLAALLVRGRASELLNVTADGLARHLSLLFVPAGAGVMLHVTQIEAEWVPIVAALAISTVLALAATAFAFQWLVRRQEQG